MRSIKKTLFPVEWMTHEEMDDNHRKSRLKIIAVATVAIIIIAAIAITWYRESQPIILTFNTSRGDTLNATNWTITAFNNDLIYLKSQVYVSTKNATGEYLIGQIPILIASGTKGFNYSGTANSDALSVGDVFSLDIVFYKEGSTLVLTNEIGVHVYCYVTV